MDTQELTPSKVLRNQYGCSRKTWYIWLLPLVEKGLVRKNAKLYRPAEMKAIQNHIDPP